MHWNINYDRYSCILPASNQIPTKKNPVKQSFSIASSISIQNYFSLQTFETSYIISVHVFTWKSVTGEKMLYTFALAGDRAAGALKSDTLTHHHKSWRVQQGRTSADILSSTTYSLSISIFVPKSQFELQQPLYQTGMCSDRQMGYLCWVPNVGEKMLNTFDPLGIEPGPPGLKSDTLPRRH